MKVPAPPTHPPKPSAHVYTDFDVMGRWVRALNENRTSSWLQFTLGAILAIILFASLTGEVGKLRRELETQHGPGVCVEGEP